MAGKAGRSRACAQPTTSLLCVGRGRGAQTGVATDVDAHQAILNKGNAGELTRFTGNREGNILLSRCTQLVEAPSRGLAASEALPGARQSGVETAEVTHQREASAD